MFYYKYLQQNMPLRTVAESKSNSWRLYLNYDVQGGTTYMS